MTRNKSHTLIGRCAVLAATIGLAVSFGGCSREEKILDVEAPGLDVEVTEDVETGEITVDGAVGEEENE